MSSPEPTRLADVLAEALDTWAAPAAALVIAQPCPYCHARPGARCTRPARRGTAPRPPHPSRIEAASTAAGEDTP